MLEYASGLTSSVEFRSGSEEAYSTPHQSNDTAGNGIIRLQR